MFELTFSIKWLKTNWKLSYLLKAYKMTSNCSSCCRSIEDNGKMTQQKPPILQMAIERNYFITMHHQAGVHFENFTEVKFRDILLTRIGHRESRLNGDSPAKPGRMVGLFVDIRFFWTATVMGRVFKGVLWVQNGPIYFLCGPIKLVLPH